VKTKPFINEEDKQPFARAMGSLALCFCLDNFREFAMYYCSNSGDYHELFEKNIVSVAEVLHDLMHQSIDILDAEVQ
jgi:hypothetical protein